MKESKKIFSTKIFLRTLDYATVSSIACRVIGRNKNFEHMWACEIFIDILQLSY